MKPKLFFLFLLAATCTTLLTISSLPPVTALAWVVIGLVFGIPVLIITAFFIFVGTASLAWVARRYLLHLPGSRRNLPGAPSWQHRRAA